MPMQHAGNQVQCSFRWKRFTTVYEITWFSTDKILFLSVRESEKTIKSDFHYSICVIKDFHCSICVIKLLWQVGTTEVLDWYWYKRQAFTCDTDTVLMTRIVMLKLCCLSNFFSIGFWSGCWKYSIRHRSRHLKNKMSHLMTKPTKLHVLPAKTQISLGIHPVLSWFCHEAAQNCISQECQIQ